jgi:endonuclease YncB( thermonuclease family)
MERLKTARPAGPKLPRHKSRHLTWGAAGAAVAVAAFGAILVVERTNRASDNAATRSARPGPAEALRAVTPQPPSPALADPGAPKSPNIDDRPIASPDPVARGAVRLDPPFLIVDGITFKTGFDTYRLKDVSGPPATAACRGEDGHLWACGLRARAALNNAIQHGQLTCIPAQSAVDGAIEAACTVEGRDLGGQLVKQGWARPLGETYMSETRAAERDRRGLWNGGWVFDAPG